MIKNNLFLLVSLLILQSPHILFAPNATKRAQKKAKRDLKTLALADSKRIQKIVALYKEEKQREEKEWAEQEEAFENYESAMEGTYTLKLVTKWICARYFKTNN
jgi:hypothetical protein